MHTDVLVIGAGPAGSAAAAWLAAAGVHVALVDREEFPRDKTCGDALIPDALAALDRLGLRQRVLEAARFFPAMRLYAPDRSFVELEAEMAMLPRAVLDDALRLAAVERGAVFLAPLALKGMVDEDGMVAGARFRDRRTDQETEIRAELTILATGASAAALAAAKVCRRPAPSAVAARGYFRVPVERAREWNRPCLVFDASVLPGYGWIFPGPDNLFNVGVGRFFDTPRRPPADKDNLGVLWRRFLQGFPPARELLAGAEAEGELRGAPLRCGLEGAALHRPGLLVAGEAAGTTYSFSGEGIGKALETGVLAADLVKAALDGRVSREEAGARYGAELKARFSARFEAYRRAQAWLAVPVLCNVLAGRARRGRYAKAQLTELLNETGQPGTLFSPLGLAKALLF